jgi:RimJ/RimL family protein N-acetyltransferase
VGEAGPAIRLEPLVQGHAEEMFEVLAAPEIYAYLDEPGPLALGPLRERYRKLETRLSTDGTQQWLNWVVRIEATRQCAGFVQATVYPDATAGFAYVLAPQFWGRGIAHAACVEVIDLLCRDYGVRALYATVDARNARSINLLLRLGFAPLGREAYPHGEVAEGDRAFAKQLVISGQS